MASKTAFAALLFFSTWLFHVTKAASCENPAEFCYPCNLVEFKKQSFGFLELLRSCNFVDFATIKPFSPAFADVDFSCSDLGFPPLPPTDPLVPLKLNDSIYFNFEIKQDAVGSFEDYLGLPDGFELAKIAFLRGEEPKYYISSYFYKTRIDFEDSTRSYWATYVTKGDDPKPRLLVIDIFSDKDTSDPTQNAPEFSLAASNVLYKMENGQIYFKNPSFEATLAFEQSGPSSKASKKSKGKKGKKSWNANRLLKSDSKKGSKKSGKSMGSSTMSITIEYVDSQWAEANDVVYYTNGVADAVYYNGELFDVPVLSFDPSNARVQIDSALAAFVSEDGPSNIVLYEKSVEFGYTPLVNLQEAPIDPVYAAQLNQFREISFGIASYGNAFSVSAGEAEPILQFNLQTNVVPSVYVNYLIQDADGLMEFLNLPPRFELAKIKMTESDPPLFLLSLNVYELIDFTGLSTAPRAEWSIYVHDTNDPAFVTVPTFMVIDVESQIQSLDSFNGQTPANTDFDYSLSGNTASIDIPQFGAGTTKFSMSFDLPNPDETSSPLSTEFIVSNDRVYWRSGTYDRVFYNGQFLDADVAEVDLNTVTTVDNTPWANFVDPDPIQVLVVRNNLEFVIYPWNNVDELCAAVS